jgi:hypothetical protein
MAKLAPETRKAFSTASELSIVQTAVFLTPEETETRLSLNRYREAMDSAVLADELSADEQRETQEWLRRRFVELLD